jgi:hypothetical protein
LEKSHPLSHGGAGRFMRIRERNPATWPEFERATFLLVAQCFRSLLPGVSVLFRPFIVRHVSTCWPSLVCTYCRVTIRLYQKHRVCMRHNIILHICRLRWLYRFCCVLFFRLSAPPLGFSYEDVVWRGTLQERRTFSAVPLKLESSHFIYSVVAPLLGCFQRLRFFNLFSLSYCFMWSETSSCTLSAKFLAKSEAQSKDAIKWCVGRLAHTSRGSCKMQACYYCLSREGQRNIDLLQFIKQPQIMARIFEL